MQLSSAAVESREIRNTGSRGERRRCGSEIGDQIRDRLIGIVSDSGHNWNTRREYGPREAFLVESRQVLGRTASPHEKDDVRIRKAIDDVDGKCHFIRASFALHRSPGRDYADEGILCREPVNNVVIGLTPR
jgi:hypothetical protein